eukprot:TRINITY_DN538_c0_g1_i4.p1 TRINITY_DN538_c0_g1~~TRINITY_DN538_c0_g1_i4.p1  ORF type:complete len:758 (-),score=146.96 TRINITY_DN538_c0_g1_i4:2328-4601(-)
MEADARGLTKASEGTLEATDKAGALSDEYLDAALESLDGTGPFSLRKDAAGSIVPGQQPAPMAGQPAPMAAAQRSRGDGESDAEAKASPARSAGATAAPDMAGYVSEITSRLELVLARGLGELRSCVREELRGQADASSGVPRLRAAREPAPSLLSVLSSRSSAASSGDSVPRTRPNSAPACISAEMQSAEAGAGAQLSEGALENSREEAEQSEINEHVWARRHMRAYTSANLMEDQEESPKKQSGKRGITLLGNKSGKSASAVVPKKPFWRSSSKGTVGSSIAGDSVGSEGDSVVPCDTVSEVTRESPRSQVRRNSRFGVGSQFVKRHLRQRGGPGLVDDGSLRYQVGRIVLGTFFDSAVCIVILLNAVFAGLTADMEARDPGAPLPIWLGVCDIFFMSVFVIELCLRIFLFRMAFFYMPGWGWNLFDLSAIGLELIQALVKGFSPSARVVPGGSYTFARVLRLMRLVRIVRLIRVLRLIAELRTLVTSIILSMRSLLWTAVLMLFIIYTTSIYVTEMVSQARSGESFSRIEVVHVQALKSFYGSLDKTMLTLFQSITGGLDWNVNLTPLIEVSPWAAFVFSLYVAFSILAMLNVVTGIFVDSVLQSAKKDKDLFMMNNARELFQTEDGQRSSSMSWAVFESKLQATQMQEFFRAIDVDLSEAKGLFHLLDLDGSGNISAEEFLNGALRLRGAAKALDLALLIQEVRQIKRWIASSMRSQGARGPARQGIMETSTRGAHKPDTFVLTPPHEVPEKT